MLTPLVSPSCGSCGTQTNTKQNQLHSAIQICIRSNKNQKTSKNKTLIIVSRVASESIRNMNETVDSNKNRNEICKMMKQRPNMLDMLKIYCKKWKKQKESEFQKLTQNRLVYDKLSLNLEPKVNDVRLSYNFIYSAISTQIDRI